MKYITYKVYWNNKQLLKINKIININNAFIKIYENTYNNYKVNYKF